MGWLRTQDSALRTQDFFTPTAAVPAFVGVPPLGGLGSIPAKAGTPTKTPALHSDGGRSGRGAGGATLRYPRARRTASTSCHVGNGRQLRRMYRSMARANSIWSAVRAVPGNRSAYRASANWDMGAPWCGFRSGRDRAGGWVPGRPAPRPARGRAHDGGATERININSLVNSFVV